MFARWGATIMLTTVATDIVPQSQCRQSSIAMATTPTATATRTSFRAETRCFTHYVAKSDALV